MVGQYVTFDLKIYILLFTKFPVPPPRPLSHTRTHLEAFQGWKFKFKLTSQSLSVQESYAGGGSGWDQAHPGQLLPLAGIWV